MLRILVCTLALMVPHPSVRAVDFSVFFKDFAPTPWHRSGSLNWSKRFVSKEGHNIATTTLTTEGIMIKVSTQCLKNDELSVTWWRLGDSTGTRSDCSNIVTKVPTNDLDELVGELPDELVTIMRRYFMVTPKRMTQWNI